MTERPIIFQADMVRAILEGRKTQTRRVVKLRHGGVTFTYPGNRFVVRSRTRHVLTLENAVCAHEIDAPYRTGDRLWVRETWGLTCAGGWAVDPSTLTFRAGGYPPHRIIRPEQFAPIGEIEQRPDPQPDRWRPSIHMPRWASRIDLEITAVRVERVQDISVEDALDEGIVHSTLNCPRMEFAQLWNRINGPDAWDQNPWVWVIEFKRLTT